MERIVNVSKSYEEALQWDIEQCLAMSPDERMAAARELRERVYGKDNPDVREIYSKQ